MKTYKYKLQHQDNLYRLRQMKDDMWQVHDYFHRRQDQRYKDGLSYANYSRMSAEVTDLKKTTHPHWNALPSQAIQMELRRIDSAYQDFFDKKGGRPRRKSRKHFKSWTYPGTSGWEIDSDYDPEHVGRIQITFRYWNEDNQCWSFDRVWYSFFKHRKFYGNILRITIKYDRCGDFWLCITTDHTDHKPFDATCENVGCDFGMKDGFLILSTGEKIDSPQWFKQALRDFRRLNKSLSRKIKSSNNWYRAKRALARLHRHITNQRLDWQYKLATKLCREFDAIAIETLNIAGMKRLWGRKISDLAPAQFFKILEYKCIKHSRELLKVGQWTATTKPCNKCGHRNENLTLADRSWTCPKCNTQHDRDINAAKNILKYGLA